MLFLVACAGAACAGAASLARGPEPAGAVVSHVAGFRAVVDGWRSWYGSYGMAELGPAWCIDHGIRAPDPAYRYEPASLDRPDSVRRAVAWAAGAHGRSARDPVTAAALMLALHDLMGARYPGGVLQVDHLTENGLAGFGGAAGEVLARARGIRADALAHSHLTPPYRLEINVPAVRPGAPGEAVAMLMDANGAPVAGVLLHAAVTGAVLTGPVEAPTGADGTLRLPFRGVAGENRFHVSGLAPSLEPDVWRPTTRAAQRVVRPAVVEVAATAAFTALADRTLVVHKVGDAEPWLPVAGARFAVDGVDGELIVGADGRTPPVQLPAGRYVLRETVPPDGYAPAPPVEIDLTHGDAVVKVANQARRGAIALTKTDAVTGELLPGARFELAHDATGDGRYAVLAEDMVTGDAGTASRDDLLPGRYRLVETAPPPGYAARAEPVHVTVAPGEVVEVAVADEPRATVAFQKVPAKAAGPSLPSLAGARFVVRSEGTPAVEAGACTTDEDGRCSLPPLALAAHGRYCWEEVEAPPGWLPAPGRCFQAAGAGSTTRVEVEEALRQATPATTLPPPTTTVPPPPTTGPPPTTVPPPAAAPAPADVVLASLPSSGPSPRPAPVRATLPVTGPLRLASLVGAGVGALVTGVLLLVAAGTGAAAHGAARLPLSPAASWWGSRGRRRPRPRR